MNIFFFFNHFPPIIIPIRDYNFLSQKPAPNLLPTPQLYYPNQKFIANPNPTTFNFLIAQLVAHFNCISEKVQIAIDSEIELENYWISVYR